MRGGYTEGDWKKVAALSPLMSGLTRKEEIVGLICYLLSDTARYVSGQFSCRELRRKHCLNEHALIPSPSTFLDPFSTVPVHFPATDTRCGTREIDNPCLVGIDYGSLISL